MRDREKIKHHNMVFILVVNQSCLVHVRRPCAHGISFKNHDTRGLEPKLSSDVTISDLWVGRASAPSPHQSNNCGGKKSMGKLHAYASEVVICKIGSPRFLGCWTRLLLWSGFDNIIAWKDGQNIPGKFHDKFKINLKNINIIKIE